MSALHRFRHHAMATYFEARIEGADGAYAGQAAQAGWERIDALERSLSRYRPDSEIRRIAALTPGEELRISEDTFACLLVAQAMEQATRAAFSATAAALRDQATMPRWTLSAETSSIRCDRGRLDFDLGAVGKGFALDRMGELLREWECDSFLLVAGGSSILVGGAPQDRHGWSCGLGDDDAPNRLVLADASLSGSGLGIQGQHILDPQTGQPARRESRAWAVCDTAGESDALSTAAMVLAEPELLSVLAAEPRWLVLIEGEGLERGGIRSIGSRPVAQEV